MCFAVADFGLQQVEFITNEVTIDNREEHRKYLYCTGLNLYIAF